MKYVLTASVILVTGLIGIGAYAGYLAGEYRTTETFQKQAVAHSCGDYKREDLTFSWKVPAEVREAETAATNSTKPNTSKGIMLNAPSLQ